MQFVGGIGCASVLAASLAQAQVVAAPAASRIHPFRAMAVTVVNGRLIPASPWIRVPFVRTLGDTAPAFDAFGGDTSGQPTGFCDAGCLQNNWCPFSSPDTRWWGGPNFRSPMSTNDMAVAPGLAGYPAFRAQFAWWWAHSTPMRCYVALLTGTQFSTCPSADPPQSGDLGGIVFDFGDLMGLNGYWWSDIDLHGLGLSWDLPAAGSYTIMLGTAYDPGSANFMVDQAYGTQPMRWGNGDRPGSSGPMQWDDWRNANGHFEWNECSYYDDSQHCPIPEGAMVSFWVERCYANCDSSTGAPLLTANDFQCFLNAYATGELWANCDNSAGNPILTANDFQCFLNKFAGGCT